MMSEIILDAAMLTFSIVILPIYCISSIVLSVLYWRENWSRPTMDRIFGALFMAVAWPVILAIIQRRARSFMG